MYFFMPNPLVYKFKCLKIVLVYLPYESPGLFQKMEKSEIIKIVDQPLRFRKIFRFDKLYIIRFGIER